MDINTILNWIGAGVLLFYAAASIVRPRFVAQALEHGLETGRGVSEFRVLHGGFFIGMALFVLVANTPVAFHALGWAWVCAAAIRLAAYLPDRPALPLSVVGLVAEAALGVFLLI